LIFSLLGELGDEVVFLRDVTRGGLAGVVADLARDTGQDVTLWEESLPIRASTLHAAEMLGIDPLDVANEGKVVIVVRPFVAQRALQLLRQQALGREAAIIGQVEPVASGRCVLHTRIGGRRIVQKPYGEQLPRIC
jgi:hydrogenase expression/formation protein HypE